MLVGFTDNYGRLLGKRLDARFFLDETLGQGTHACDYLLTVDMEMEPVPSYDYASWELGYGDFHLVADVTTLVRAGWTDSSAIVLCDVVDVHTHERVTVAPRSMLEPSLNQRAGTSRTTTCSKERRSRAMSAPHVGPSPPRASPWRVRRANGGAGSTN